MCSLASFIETDRIVSIGRGVEEETIQIAEIKKGEKVRIKLGKKNPPKRKKEVL